MQEEAEYEKEFLKNLFIFGFLYIGGIWDGLMVQNHIDEKEQNSSIFDKNGIETAGSI